MKKYPAVFKDGEAEYSFILRQKKSIPFGTRFAVNMGMKMGFMQFVEIRFR